MGRLGQTSRGRCRLSAEYPAFRFTMSGLLVGLRGGGRLDGGRQPDVEELTDSRSRTASKRLIYTRVKFFYNFSLSSVSPPGRNRSPGLSKGYLGISARHLHIQRRHLWYVVIVVP